ncbi:MAG: hypothetical protein V4507_06870 [Verrucomicrobiota bacterium]
MKIGHRGFPVNPILQILGACTTEINKPTSTPVPIEESEVTEKVMLTLMSNNEGRVAALVNQKLKWR